MKKKLAGIVIGAMFVFGSSSVALAGEVTGTGEAINVVAASDCAYSGLEDDDGGPNGGPGVTPQTPKGSNGAPGLGFDHPQFGFVGCNPQDSEAGPGLGD